MADTLQIVRWSLAHRCALRQGEAVTEPAEALGATVSLLAYEECRRQQSNGSGVFGDVCVTAYTYAIRPGRGKGPRLPYPSSGFVVTEKFAPHGNVDALLAACAQCPVNLSADRPAACAGTLSQNPDSQETEEQLRSIASRLGLEAAIAAAFPPTTQLWYGFWIESPVRPEAARLLHLLIDAMADEDSRDTTPNWSESQPTHHVRQLRAFARAAELAATGRATLHVSLAPPGHTDFGFYTIFAHCPHCKAAADVPRWTRAQQAALYHCTVCGTDFSPAETASSLREDYEIDNLRPHLGQPRFEQLAADYLVAHGAAPDEARAIVAATEQAERERLIQLEQTRLLNERKRAWVRAVLYAGLTVHRVKYEGDQDDPGTEMFSANDMLEIIRRARERHVVVRSLIHHSKSGANDKYAFERLSDPIATVEQWRAEGCNDFFRAEFQIRDELLP